MKAVPSPLLPLRIALDREPLASRAEKLKRLYPRTESIAPFDPDGTMFMIDIADIVSSQSKDCKELDFVAFGCHGTGAASLRHLEGKGQLPGILFRALAGKQKAVGAAIVRFMVERRRRGRRPFGFVLGDNFYESGIPSDSPEVVDRLFEKAFVDVYRAGGRRGAPPHGFEYFGALGNHDYNFHGHAIRPVDGSRFADHLARALAQVDSTYRSRREGGWNLPYRYYCAVSPIANFFVVDTSTFLFDEHQQDWLRQAHEKLSVTRRFSFLMGHHGFVSFGERGAGRDPAMRGSFGIDLCKDVHRHIFQWIVREDMHFHFNVVAHDHFLASAWLRYEAAPGLLRRTHYVLSGGGGAWPGEPSVDALARLGPTISHIDSIEKRHGFAHFRLTRETAEVNFRFVDGQRAWDAWQPGERVFGLDDAALWFPTERDIDKERRERPTLSGILYEVVESRVSLGKAYRRRYFEIEREGGLLRFGDKPGKLARNGITIDPRRIDASSCSWRGDVPERPLFLDGSEYRAIEFRTRKPRRRWHLAVPKEAYADVWMRLESGLAKA